MRAAGQAPLPLASGVAGREGRRSATATRPSGWPSITRRAVAEMKAGLGRPAAEMLADMQEVINQKRG